MKLKKIVATIYLKQQGKCLFNDLSLSYHEDFMVINGDNGVGKSTLIKVLIGLIKSDSDHKVICTVIILCIASDIYHLI